MEEAAAQTAMSGQRTNLQDLSEVNPKPPLASETMCYWPKTLLCELPAAKNIFQKNDTFFKHLLDNFILPDSHTCSLTPCVKVSSTSTISACTLVSSPSRRPDAGMEHTVMWSVTNTLATRVSLNWKAPPRRSSVSMVRNNLSVLIHILRIMQRCGVGPMCPCRRHGCSNTLHSFCRTRTHVSRPSPENSWTPAKLHFRSLCWPAEKTSW